jgi:ParB family chromosome partitioning protein
MERLLRENENRGKTPEQQIREGMHWEPLEEAKARKRQGTRNDLTSEKIFSEVEGGRVLDIIARRVGLGSGKTYEKGRAVREIIHT